MPHILQLPPEVFSSTASFLGAKQIVQLRSVCRTFNTAVQGWRNNAAHPLHQLLSRSGVYWLRHDGVFYTPTVAVMGLGVGFRVELSLDEEQLSNHFSVDEDLHIGEDVIVNGPSNMVGKLLHARVHCSTLIVGRKIYRFGGRHVSDGSDVRLQSCFCVDPVSWTVRPLPPMSCKRSSLAAVSIGTRIYLFGGYNGTRELDSMEVFDTRTESWLLWDSAAARWRDRARYHSSDDDNVATLTTRTLSMPFSVCEHSAVAVAERYVILMGGCRHRGQEGEASTSSVWLFDTVTTTWEQLRDMPYDRIHGCASYRCIEVFDGSNNNNEEERTTGRHRCQHKVVFCGGKPLRAKPNESPTLVLQWSGDDVQSLRDATWASNDVAGAQLTLNITAVQYNCHDPTHPTRAPFRVVIGPNSLTLRKNPAPTMAHAEWGDEAEERERWYRDPSQIRGAVFGVCSIE